MNCIVGLFLLLDMASLKFFSFGSILMESRWSMFCISVRIESVGIDINGVACHNTKDCCIKKTQENLCSNPGDEADENNWAGIRRNLVLVAGYFHDEDTREAVANGHGQFTDNNEHRSKPISCAENANVFGVEQETVPGANAEGLA